MPPFLHRWIRRGKEGEEGRVSGDNGWLNEGDKEEEEEEEGEEEGEKEIKDGYDQVKEDVYRRRMGSRKKSDNNNNNDNGKDNKESHYMIPRTR